MMRVSFSSVVAGAALALLMSGCSGPERKLGRGMNNLTEFSRLGEIRRSVEQAAIWDSPEEAYTRGFIHGLNKSVQRTFVGLYEVVTFPVPSYEPIIEPENPVYPDSFRPNLLADPTFGPDASLGFSGGDVFPWSPGSRFKIFDY